MLRAYAKRLRAPLPAATALGAGLLAAVVGAAAPRAAKPVLPFIQDDYPRALERARAARLPIFVESWAPW